MTTFGTLQGTVSGTDLRDSANKTFDLTTVKAFINTALVEIGRVAPAFFQEDITPVANTLSYTLQSAVFGGISVPNIDVVAVEVWDASTTPDTRRFIVNPWAAEYSRDSQAGWRNWGGKLELPTRVVTNIVTASDLIRVWGYRPYPKLVNDTDVVPVGNDLEEALRQYVLVEALRRLIGSRVLFTQWQTRSNNSDVTPASLMNEFTVALNEWRAKSRAIAVIREAP